MGDEIRVLSHAVDQAGDVLDHVHAGQLDRATSCSDWTVADLVDHLIAAPDRFLTMMRGGEPDWSHDPHVAESWGPAFRNHGDDLVHAWHQHEGDPPVPADFQLAELALHTWDLATAVGYPVDRLDPEVAERALAFMQAGITDENRSPVFGPEQEAPEGAGPYERLAAFAGRTVG